MAKASKFPKPKNIPAGFRSVNACGVRLPEGLTNSMDSAAYGIRTAYGMYFDRRIGQYNVARYLNDNRQLIESSIGPAPVVKVTETADGYFDRADFSNFLGHGVQGMAFTQQVTNKAVAAKIGIPVGGMAVGKVTNSEAEVDMMKFVLNEQNNARMKFSRPLPLMIPKVGAVLGDSTCSNDLLGGHYIVRQDVQDLSTLPVLPKYSRLVKQMFLGFRLDLDNPFELEQSNQGADLPAILSLISSLYENVKTFKDVAILSQKIPLNTKLSQEGKVPRYLANFSFASDEERYELLNMLWLMSSFNLDLVDFFMYFHNKSVSVLDFDIMNDNIGWAVTEAPSYVIQPLADNGKFFSTGPVQKRIHLVARDLGASLFVTRPAGAHPGPESTLLFGFKRRRGGR